MSSSAHDVRQAEAALRDALGKIRWAAPRLPEEHPLRRLLADLGGDLADLDETLRALPKPGETFQRGPPNGA